MSSANDKVLFKEDHTYVMLNQEIASNTFQQISTEVNDGEHVEVETKGSKESIVQSKVELLAKSRFSDLTLKLLSALFYGTCSFLITVINKIVLTTYAFPSSNILGLGQMVAIILILRVASQFRLVTLRKTSLRNEKIWTLAFIYVCNLMSGLGGTKRLPLPMFIALRRFSIAMTAIGEFYLLHVKTTLAIFMTIVAMIGGSFIAAASDLTFNAIGYLLVMTSNLFTAANVVYIKKAIDSREINKHEILFYNALLTVVPLAIISYFTNDRETLYTYPNWSQTGFILSFLTSCFMGYMLMFSTVLCTHYNSALTTTIVGTLKVSRKTMFSHQNRLWTNLSIVVLIAEYIDHLRWNVHRW